MNSSLFRQALIKLMKEEEMKKVKEEKLNQQELKYDMERRKKVIEETQSLLRFSTDRYKEIHRGMLLSEVLKERDIAAKLQAEKVKLEKETIRKQVAKTSTSISVKLFDLSRN